MIWNRGLPIDLFYKEWGKQILKFSYAFFSPPVAVKKSQPNVVMNLMLKMSLGKMMILIFQSKGHMKLSIAPIIVQRLVKMVHLIPWLVNCHLYYLIFFFNLIYIWLDSEFQTLFWNYKKTFKKKKWKFSCIGVKMFQIKKK